MPSSWVSAEARNGITQWRSPFKRRLLSLGLLLELALLTVIAIPLLTFSGSAIGKLNDPGHLAQ
ncbi:MAG: hypothetical protein IPG92_10025 [Flavobacteriales bacterium]|nr:hypothetical protein [Flavobacteriales bacterium]